LQFQFQTSVLVVDLGVDLDSPIVVKVVGLFNIFPMSI